MLEGMNQHALEQMRRTELLDLVLIESAGDDSDGDMNDDNRQ